MSFRRFKNYPESYVPDKRYQFCQLMRIFDSVTLVRDIDFSNWYKQVSLIVETSEYLGLDFPFDSVFQVKFLRVFRFNYTYGTDKGGGSSDDLCIVDKMNPIGLSPGFIKNFTKEKKGEQFFYRIVTSDKKVMPYIEIDFEDVEIAFIGTCEMIGRVEKGPLFLTPKSKEKILYRLNDS
jgi:hypothetical protein